MNKSSSVLILFSTLFFLLAAGGCKQQKRLSPGEGFIKVPGGKVWYQIIGSGDKPPVLVLHGGPGIPHYYLKPLAELAQDRSIIFYDQLGCGKSDKITDSSIMTIDHYVEELNQVVHHLGLSDYVLYGQSWGTMLGTDFYLKHPDGIRALILSSPALSIPMWLKDADTLIASLPDSVQHAIRSNEQNKTYDAPEYQKAVQTYYQNFVARKLPWSPDIDSCFALMGENVYKYMGGPSEFTITGCLKSYDRTGRLGEIKVPTLFLCGAYDEARPSTVSYYHSLVPGSTFAVIDNAGHLTTQDNPEQNNKLIKEFLLKTDNPTSKN